MRVSVCVCVYVCVRGCVCARAFISRKALENAAVPRLFYGRLTQRKVSIPSESYLGDGAQRSVKVSLFTPPPPLPPSISFSLSLSLSLSRNAKAFAPAIEYFMKDHLLILEQATLKFSHLAGDSKLRNPPADTSFDTIPEHAAFQDVLTYRCVMAPRVSTQIRP